ncbi:MFS transporter [Mesorhizobium sp.]|uniref:MFS transporter n=1 Tax=Mesorhizobium sp. TaxID=1871066 RepID=UPI00338F7142
MPLDLKPRSGPIAVKLVYSITRGLSGLHARKPARFSRAGTRNWTLQRSVQTPSCWTATFRTPYLDGLSFATAIGSRQWTRK